MQIKKMVSNEKGASLISTLIIMSILILGITAVLNYTLAAYKFSNRSIDMNEEYYELDAHAQEILQSIDGILYNAEVEAINYMQSESYIIDPYKDRENPKSLESVNQYFFFKNWKERVYDKSLKLIFEKDGSRGTSGTVDVEVYNKYLTEYYNDAFAKLYYHKIYSRKSTLTQRIIREYEENLTEEEKRKYDIKVSLKCMRNKNYGWLSNPGEWDEMTPQGDEITISIDVEDTEKKKTLSIEMDVSIPLYESIVQEKTVDVCGNPLTSYAIINSGTLTYKNSSITISGDTYTYSGQVVNKSTINQYGNFYSTGNIDFNNFDSRSYYIVNPYIAGYENDLKKKIYYNSFGSKYYMNNKIYEKNLSVPAFEKFEKYTYSPDNSASIFFKDTLGGNVYCNNVITNLSDPRDANLKVLGGALTTKIQIGLGIVEVQNPEKIIQSTDTFISGVTGKSESYKDLFKYYFESKTKNGGIDLVPRKEKDSKKLATSYRVIKFDDLSPFVNLSYGDELGGSKVLIFDEENNEMNLSSVGTFSGIIYSKGNLKIKGSGRIKGAIIVDGNLTLQGNITVEHDEDVILETYKSSNFVPMFFRPGEIGPAFYSYSYRGQNPRARQAVNEERYSITKWVLE